MGGDEEVFADGKVNHIGQIIGIIVAESQPLAQRAAKAVQVTYEDLPSVITIEVSQSREPSLSTHNLKSDMLIRIRSRGGTQGAHAPTTTSWLSYMYMYTVPCTRIPTSVKFNYTYYLRNCA